MAWTLVDSGSAGFADGNAGHIVSLNAAPQANDLDVVVTNSDTVVATPTGFTSAVSAVNNQGAYIFYRFATGSEGSSVTVTTSGNFNCVVGWSRWRGGEALDAVTSAQINSSVGGSTPAVDTGALAETGELVIAAACLHRLASPEPNTPVWSSGYTGLTTVTQGTGTSGCVQFVGYKTNAGTAAETPSATWSEGAFDRYMLVATFTQSPGATIDLGRAVETDTAQTLTRSKTATVTRASETNTSGALALSKTAALGRASETDTGRPLTLSKTLVLGRAAETDTARPLAASKTVTLGRATETDTASTLTPAKTATLGRAAEADTAHPLAPGKTLALARAGETDTASALLAGQAVPIGRAAETDTVQPLTLTKVVPLGRAIESDSVGALALARAVTLGRAEETSSASVLAPAKTLAIGRAAETDTARPLSISGGIAPEEVTVTVGPPTRAWSAGAPWI